MTRVSPNIRSERSLRLRDVLGYQTYEDGRDTFGDRSLFLRPNSLVVNPASKAPGSVAQCTLWVVSIRNRSQQKDPYPGILILVERLKGRRFFICYIPPFTFNFSTIRKGGLTVEFGGDVLQDLRGWDGVRTPGTIPFPYTHTSGLGGSGTSDEGNEKGNLQCQIKTLNEY